MVALAQPGVGVRAARAVAHGRERDLAPGARAVAAAGEQRAAGARRGRRARCAAAAAIAGRSTSGRAASGRRRRSRARHGDAAAAAARRAPTPRARAPARARPRRAARPGCRRRVASCALGLDHLAQPREPAHHPRLDRPDRDAGGGADLALAELVVEAQAQQRALVLGQPAEQRGRRASARAARRRRPAPCGRRAAAGRAARGRAGAGGRSRGCARWSAPTSAGRRARGS